MRRGGAAVLVALVVLAGAARAAPAGAATGPDPIGEGATFLKLSPGFVRVSRRYGVTLTPARPARRLSGGARRRFLLPGSEGSVDPVASRLSLESEGSLVFGRGRRRVVLRHLTVRNARTPLIAKVGGGQLKIANARGRTFKRVGFASTFDAEGLRLTDKFATRLSKKLALHGVFEGGQSLGGIRAVVEPATVPVLPMGRADLQLSSAFVAKLESMFVSTNPVAPAERLSSTLFTLPFIPNGTIAPSGLAGVPRTGGSLEFLQLGSGQVFWHEFWLDLGAGEVLAEVDVEPTPTYPGKLGQVPILSLDRGGLSIENDERARTVTVSGARLSLTAEGAAELNQALAGGASSFSVGEPFGTASFTASTR